MDCSFGGLWFHLDKFLLGLGWKNSKESFSEFDCLVFGEDAVFSTDSTPQKGDFLEPDTRSGFWMSMGLLLGRS